MTTLIATSAVLFKGIIQLEFAARIWISHYLNTACNYFLIYIVFNIVIDAHFTAVMFVLCCRGMTPTQIIPQLTFYYILFLHVCFGLISFYY